MGPKDGGQTYDLKVESVSGDVGPRVSPGKGKRIVWAVSKDHPKGIDDLDVVLDVIIDRTPGRSAEEQARPKGAVYFAIPFRGEVGKEVQKDFDELVLTINEMIEKVRTSSGRQLSTLESNTWEVRSSPDEIDEMAHQYPCIRSRLYARFKKGTEPLRGQATMPCAGSRSTRSSAADRGNGGDRRCCAGH